MMRRDGGLNAIKRKGNCITQGSQSTWTGPPQSLAYTRLILRRNSVRESVEVNASASMVQSGVSDPGEDAPLSQAS